ncbi:MAG: Tm-1-like ATP-binding domain-containing protein, partial [Ruminiclostridium sp.]
MERVEMLFSEQSKTIALLGSLDTKSDEILYAKALIERGGCTCLIIDMSTRCLSQKQPGISPYQLLKNSGISEEAFAKLDKSEKVESMREAVELMLLELYVQHRFNGVLSIGGGQNARMAADAMKKLPFGVPKLLASSLMCGNRTMEQYIGTRDMMVVHTVADMEGLNIVTKTVIQNVCNAMIGMVTKKESILTSENKIKVAVSALGITSEGVRGICARLPEEYFETTCFHANGVGGRCMEELIDEDAFDLVLDMTLHEITCELFGGYCTGANDRLLKAVEKQLPMIVVPGAIDMIDYYVEKGESGSEILQGRSFVYHNSSIVHVKIRKEEALQLAETIAERLNRGKAQIVVILPHGGFSSESAPDASLYSPDIDEAFIRKMKESLKEEIRIVEVAGNINSTECQNTIMEEIIKIIPKNKILKGIELI